MFSRKAKTTAKTMLETAAKDVPSILSAGMTIRGDVIGAVDLQVDGTVIGRIEAEHVVVSRSGTVEGDIVAKAVGIHGVLSGAIRAGSVTLSATARVQGEILYEVLTMEAGAQMEANCRRISTVLAKLDEPPKQLTVEAAPEPEPEVAEEPAPPQPAPPPVVKEGPKLVVA